MDMLLLILFEEIHKNSETQKANFTWGWWMGYAIPTAKAFLHLQASLLLFHLRHQHMMQLKH
jgi:hypothetical protein